MEEEREPSLVASIIESECFTSLKEKEYYSQIRSIKFNLSDLKNPNFRSKVLLGFFKDDQFSKLKSEEMASDSKNQEREATRKRTLEECQSDWGTRHGTIQESGMFQCGKCKQSRTTYFQMQTRSADEPMTTFVTCLNCKNKWKFC
jgi:transcription elongation factor S-II